MKTDKIAYDILVDSDVFVGLLYEDDAHHERATELFAESQADEKVLVTTSYVVAETATVLSHRSGQDAARAFLRLVKTIPTLFITEDLHTESLEVFAQQAKRGTSVVDCSNIVVMRRFGIPHIFSFDKFYRKAQGQNAA
jgi:predicted nucleic acid-binding protein